MDQITIPVDELALKINEMQYDGMKFVTLTLFEPDADSSLAWVGLQESSPNLPFSVDYEDIEAVEV